ncbi:MAG: hypothetical protein HKK67_09245 [Chlorobiaceae bacterium]|nr:hypothetical protein [Chlorobiaceae bacterium]
MLLMDLPSSVVLDTDIPEQSEIIQEHSIIC